MIFDEAVEVVQDEGEEADIEDLAREARDHVVLAFEQPEQTRENNVDADEGLGQEADLRSRASQSRCRCIG